MTAAAKTAEKNGKGTADEAVAVATATAEAAAQPEAAVTEESVRAEIEALRASFGERLADMHASLREYASANRDWGRVLEAIGLPSGTQDTAHINWASDHMIPKPPEFTLPIDVYNVSGLQAYLGALPALFEEKMRALRKGIILHGFTLYGADDNGARYVNAVLEAVGQPAVTRQVRMMLRVPDRVYFISDAPSEGSVSRTVLARDAKDEIIAFLTEKLGTPTVSQERLRDYIGTQAEIVWEGQS